MENFNKELQLQTKLEERINRILCAPEFDGEAYAEKIEEYKNGITKDNARSKLYSQIENSGGRIIIKNKDGVEGYVNKKSASKIIDTERNSVKNGFTPEQHWAAAADITHSDEKGRSNIESINRFVAPLYGDNYAFITGKEIINEGRKIHSLELIGLGRLEGTLVGAVNKTESYPSS